MTEPQSYAHGAPGSVCSAPAGIARQQGQQIERNKKEDAQRGGACALLLLHGTACHTSEEASSAHASTEARREYCALRPSALSASPAQCSQLRTASHSFAQLRQETALSASPARSGDGSSSTTEHESGHHSTGVPTHLRTYAPTHLRTHLPSPSSRRRSRRPGCSSRPCRGWRPHGWRPARARRWPPCRTLRCTACAGTHPPRSPEPRRGT